MIQGSQGCTQPACQPASASLLHPPSEAVDDMGEEKQASNQLPTYPPNHPATSPSISSQPDSDTAVASRIIEWVCSLRVGAL
ncbi:hypothetical protein E2C01_092124 [Portunus trituberculatus]|uniref:Uncharacterized protein n=1 Tax=Portunus trituberculatus TaxID=210409 RepID=A0A5B7JQJ1_PORTR|nr:hypothetical protein [Portunus trituberculatus]